MALFSTIVRSIAVSFFVLALSGCGEGDSGSATSTASAASGSSGSSVNSVNSSKQPWTSTPLATWNQTGQNQLATLGDAVVMDQTDVPQWRSRQYGSGTVELSWAAPVANADGTPLIGLAGYRIRYGRSRQNLNRSIIIDNPSIQTYVIDSLLPGPWYFQVVAVNNWSVEGLPSNMASKVVI